VLTCETGGDKFARPTATWSRSGYRNRLWTSGGKRQVIHGNLVAACTATWSRPLRESADLVAATWSLKPIYIIPITYLPVVRRHNDVDKSPPGEATDAKSVELVVHDRVETVQFALEGPFRRGVVLSGYSPSRREVVTLRTPFYGDSQSRLRIGRPLETSYGTVTYFGQGTTSDPGRSFTT
jgi:hypothetical protein